MKSLALVTLLVLAGCASSQAEPLAQPGTVPMAAQPPAPAALDPVGMFDFSTNVEGMGPVSGTVTITKAATGAGYTGTIATTATETIPVRTVAVDGQKLTVSADTPDGPVTFVLEFKGDEFTGTWSYAGMTGVHTGKRRKS